MTIRLAIVDDHPMVTDGLDAALATIEDLEVVARGGSLSKARELLVRPDVDVVLLDVRLERVPDRGPIKVVFEEIFADERHKVDRHRNDKPPQANVKTALSAVQIEDLAWMSTRRKGLSLRALPTSASSPDLAD